MSVWLNAIRIHSVSLYLSILLGYHTLMRIGIDFDDVIADSMQTIIDLQNKQFGTSYKREDATHFHLEDIWGGTKEEWRAKLDDFLSTKHLASLNPVAGVIPALDALKKGGHELYIVTGRSEEGVAATEQWVAEHFPETFAGIHYGFHLASDPTKSRKKSEICKENKVELMIEDHFGNAKECAEAGIRVFLFDQPWNQGELPQNIERIKSWDEIVTKLS